MDFDQFLNSLEMSFLFLCKHIKTNKLVLGGDFNMVLLPTPNSRTARFKNHLVFIVYNFHPHATNSCLGNVATDLLHEQFATEVTSVAVSDHDMVGTDIFHTKKAKVVQNVSAEPVFLLDISPKTSLVYLLVG